MENTYEVNNQRLSPKEVERVKRPCLVYEKGGVSTVDAADMYYRDLNSILKTSGYPIKEIHLRNVNGQRYIGTGLKGNLTIHIHGTPGNDLAAFMDGSTIYVHGNAQDEVGNTMNSGKVVIYGRSGDIVGYAMRGGSIFIRDDAGYRVAVNMKEYDTRRPIIVVGGTAQDFLGEYMAGGILVVLGLTLKEGEIHKARFVGTGMHGGVMYIRGRVANVAKDAKTMELEESDMSVLRPIIEEFCNYFKLDANTVLKGEFRKLVPSSSRPYGALYNKH